MRKKKNALFMAVVFAAVLGGITGCSDTKPTEEQLVIPKTELGQQILTEDRANAGQAEDGNSASTDSAQNVREPREHCAASAGTRTIPNRFFQ